MNGSPVAAVARRTIAEALEPRMLFAAPIAADDVFDAVEDKKLTVTAGETSIHLEGWGWIFDGDRTWSEEEGSFQAFRNIRSGVSIRFDSYEGLEDWDWSVDLAVGGSPLVPGTYLGATRYPFSHSVATMNVSGNGRGNNTLTGKFTVLQANYNADGTVRNFAAEFEQSSGGIVSGTVKYRYIAPDTKSGVLANDQDVDGDTLTAALVSGPANGALSLHGDGTFTYMPDSGFNGEDTFTYRVSDGTGSRTATAKLNVASVNDAPSFIKGPDITVAEDAGRQSVHNWATSITAGPTNESAQSRSFLVTANSNSALFAVAPVVDGKTGRLTYTPAPDAHGTATITLSLKDGGGTSNGGVDTSQKQTFTITVTPAYDAPVASDDYFSTGVGRTLTVQGRPPQTWLYVDSDPGEWVGQGQTRTYTTGDGPFELNPNSYRQFYLRFGDPGRTDWWNVELEAPGGAQFAIGRYEDAVRHGNATRPSMYISANGNAPSNYTGHFTVHQAVYGSDERLVQFGADFEQRSTATGKALRGQVRYNYTDPIGLLANDVNRDGSSLTAALVTGPQHGHVSLTADGFFKYTPNPGFSGVDTFTYRVADGTAEGNIGTVRITVDDASVDGQLYDDSNANGIRDAGETPMAGLAVFLDSNGDGAHDAGEPLVTTDADGQYRFADVTPGKYLLHARLPARWRFVNPVPYVIKAKPGHDYGRDFAITRRAFVTGVLFDDRDADGVKDEDEPYLARTQVYVDANNDGVFNAGEVSARTSGGGRFEMFAEAGTATVRQTFVERRATTPDAAFRVAHGGAAFGLVLGSTQRTLIRGTVFMDANMNGGKDELESGLAGWLVFIDTDGNGQPSFFETATRTDAFGRYTLTGWPTAGRYRVCIAENPNYRRTAPAAGARVVLLGPGGIATRVNFGLKRILAS